MITILLLIGLVLYVTIGSVKLLKQINRIEDKIDEHLKDKESYEQSLSYKIESWDDGGCSTGLNSKL